MKLGNLEQVYWVTGILGHGCNCSVASYNAQILIFISNSVLIYYTAAHATTTLSDVT